METVMDAVRTASRIEGRLSQVVNTNKPMSPLSTLTTRLAQAEIKNLKECFGYLATLHEMGAYWEWKTGEVKVGVPVELTEAQAEALNNNEPFKACLNMYYKDKWGLRTPPVATWKWSKDYFEVTFKDAPSA